MLSGTCHGLTGSLPWVLRYASSPLSLGKAQRAISRRPSVAQPRAQQDAGIRGIAPPRPVTLGSSRYLSSTTQITVSTLTRMPPPCPDAARPTGFRQGFDSLIDALIRHKPRFPKCLVRPQGRMAGLSRCLNTPPKPPSWQISRPMNLGRLMRALDPYVPRRAGAEELHQFTRQRDLGRIGRDRAGLCRYRRSRPSPDRDTDRKRGYPEQSRGRSALPARTRHSMKITP